MMSDESKVLMEFVQQFCRDEIDNASADIERRGMSGELSKKLAAQGFYSFVPGEKHGGAAVERSLYLRILGEFASHSPSVALQISLINSVILKTLETMPGSEEMMETIMKGEAIPAIPMSYRIMSPDSIDLHEEGKLDADVKISAFFGYPALLLRNADGMVMFIKDIHGEDPVETPLGFRGIKQLHIHVKGSGYEQIGRIKEDINIDGEIASIAAGIARGSISKAVGYSRVRNTFNHPLKDYGPVAFKLSELSSSLTVLENYLYSDAAGDEDLLKAKVMALKLANQASREAVQTHGGYGYIEDFGIEKYYRDAMALASMLSNRLEDLSRLAGTIYSEKAGFI